jgi:maleate isomerase
MEIPEMASPGVEVVVARIPRRGDTATAPILQPPSGVAHLRTLAEPSALHRTVASLREAMVDVIAYASTTSGYAIGHAAEATVIRHLRRVAGVPVVTSGLAATQALKTFGVHRVALVHPPWFDEDFDALGATYFRDQEIDAVVLTATQLPRHPDQVRSEQVIDWVGRHVDGSTEAVFIAGNGFRAAHTIEELERRTGQLVLEADQVLLWSILTATRTTLQIDGYGRLFRAAPRVGGVGVAPGGSRRLIVQTLIVNQFSPAVSCDIPSTPDCGGSGAYATAGRIPSRSARRDRAESVGRPRRGGNGRRRPPTDERHAGRGGGAAGESASRQPALIRERTILRIRFVSRAAHGSSPPQLEEP